MLISNFFVIYENKIFILCILVQSQHMSLPSVAYNMTADIRLKVTQNVIELTPTPP
jgi:hypothetical protein